MARPDKVAAVAELQKKLTESTATVLTEYRGLSVADLKELRRSLGDQATYAIAKNTLIKIAVNNAGIEGLDDKLEGPTAIAFISGDIATVAKGLRDFAKANPLLVIKGGVMDGQVLDADTVKKLADLESREVLLSKLAGAMKGTAQKAVSLFAAPLVQAAQLFGALQTKAEADPSVLAGGAPAAETQEQDSPADAAAAPVAETSDETATPEAAADGADETAASEAAPDAADAADGQNAADAASEE